MHAHLHATDMAITAEGDAHTLAHDAAGALRGLRPLPNANGRVLSWSALITQQQEIGPFSMCFPARRMSGDLQASPVTHPHSTVVRRIDLQRHGVAGEQPMNRRSFLMTAGATVAAAAASDVLARQAPAPGKARFRTGLVAYLTGRRSRQRR